MFSSKRDISSFIKKVKDIGNKKKSFFKTRKMSQKSNFKKCSKSKKGKKSYKIGFCVHKIGFCVHKFGFCAY